MTDRPILEPQEVIEDRYMIAPTDTTTTFPFEETDPGDAPAEPFPQPTTTTTTTTTTTVPPARPERFPQSTIPGDNLGACYAYNTGEVWPHGQYTLGPLERPHDGTTEIGALKCWVPQRVEVVDTFGKPECGEGEMLIVLRERPPSYQCVPRPDTGPLSTVITAPAPVVGAVPVPTAVNTGDELAVGGGAGFFLVSASLTAVAAAALLGRRKVRS